MKPCEVLFSIILISILTKTGHSMSPDGEVLLSIKSAITDTEGVLAQWKSEDPDPCGWKGVKCDPKSKSVVHLGLAYHRLRGYLSPDIGKLRHLKILALHDNNFYGTIPSELGNCTALRALYLQDNFLSGFIPKEFGQLLELEILDISSNTLSGTIPVSLEQLTNLSTFNVSTNFLVGKIPSGGALSKFTEQSFVGNRGLCGKQINVICKSELEGPINSESPVAGGYPSPYGVIYQGAKKRSARNSTKLLISALATVGALLLVALMCFWGCFLYKKFGKNDKPHAMDVSEGTRLIYVIPLSHRRDGVVILYFQELSNKGASIIMFHGDLPYSSKDIIRKIEALNDENIIGSGGFGTVYRLTMDDGNVFALKRIVKTNDGLDRFFERELEILGSIKHRYLVNLRGYCNSPSSKLLIYDFLPGGNLDEVLHERSDQLDWDARVKIIVGAAKGLAYLHHDCSPRIIHRDIKSSNILLDMHMDARVSDFGLAKLLEDEASHITTIVAGTFGYLAPEYINSGRATEKSDVYSFGVLVLEVLSRKRPTDSLFIEKGLNIVGWLNHLVEENKQTDIIDQLCEGVQPESFHTLLSIAIQCVSPNPEERPTMHRVLQILESEVLTPCPSDFYDSNSDS